MADLLGNKAEAAEKLRSLKILSTRSNWQI